jgi:hypothetical protein
MLGITGVSLPSPIGCTLSRVEGIVSIAATLIRAPYAAERST